MRRRDFLAASAATTFAKPLMATQPLHVRPEESHHEATFMMWPVNRAVHPDKAFLGYLQQTIADIANTIVEFEPVIMLASAGDHARAQNVKRFGGFVGHTYRRSLGT
jgi:agmatine deiminase